MRYTPAIKTSNPETLRAMPLQRGQWINYDGANARFCGVSPSGVIWIAYGRTARRHFDVFARAYRNASSH